MSKLTLAFFLYTSVSLCNPFTAAWNFIRRAEEPKGVEGCKILDRDFSRGPVVDKKEWNTPCILKSFVTSAQLANVKDAAEFLNARKELANLPTKAVWVSQLDGRVSEMSSKYMITFEDALPIITRLQTLGCDAKVKEVEPKNPFSTIDYRGEIRKHLYLGQMSVALANDAYAGWSVERIDAQIKAEISSCKEN